MGFVVFFLASGAVLATPWLTPVGAFFTITGIFGLKKVIEETFANSYNTELIDDILKQHAELSTEITKNSVVNIEEWHKIEVENIQGEINEKLRKKSKNESNSNYISRIIKCLDDFTYDQASLLVNLEAMINIITKNNDANDANDAKVIITALRIHILASGKLNKMMQHMKNSHLYNFSSGVISGLLLGLLMSPFIPIGGLVTNIPVSILGGNIQWIKRIEASVAGILDVIIPTKASFYEHIGKSQFGKWLIATEMQEAAEQIFLNAEKPKIRELF